MCTCIDDDGYTDGNTDGKTDMYLYVDIHLFGGFDV